MDRLDIADDTHIERTASKTTNDSPGPPCHDTQRTWRFGASFFGVLDSLKFNVDFNSCTGTFRVKIVLTPCEMMRNAFFVLPLVVCEQPIVRTTTGILRGVWKNGIKEYLGVRYATAGRFEPPQLTQEDLQNATTPGPICVQSSGGDEDCLLLNVFEPAGGWTTVREKRRLLEKRRPVFFYLHGGGFVSGQATTKAWNLTKLANVVVVAPQYRLGVFGFFNGNYGLQDQLLAFKWTVANAEVFGGDPEKILVIGCSAGGASVANLLLNDIIFKAAAIESPGTHCGWKNDTTRSDDDFMSLSLRTRNAATLEEEINVSTVDASTLYAQAKSLRFAPALVDPDTGNETYPLALLRKNELPDVPLIVGGQSCESCGDAANYLGPPSNNVTYDQLRDAVTRAGFGPQIGVDTVLGWYEERRQQEGNWRVFARILSDSDHACSTVLHAEALAAQPRLWRYFFAYSGDVPYPGATHCGIENYIWHTDGKSDILSTALSTWLTNLVLNDDVNTPGTLPFWDPYNNGTSPVMFLGLDDDPTPRMNTSLDTTRPECDHWRPYLGW